MPDSHTAAAPVPEGLPDSLRAEVHGRVLQVTLNRPAKRNALDDETMLGLERVFTGLHQDIGAVLLTAEGQHFSAGLDLNEMTDRDTYAGVAHSRMWHRIFASVESGPVPVVSALKGAVIGGGLELAAATHIRVAEESTFYGLPEGQRGLFVGGGGSVRLPRLIGTATMADMMLTGRTYDAAGGQAIGLSQYVVPTGTSSDVALDLAQRITRNSPTSNFAVVQALPRIAEANPREGYLMEALMAAIAQGTDDAKSRMNEFLAGRSTKVAPE